MAGTITVDTIQSDTSYASTINVASKINFTAGMQIGGQDATLGGMRNRLINGDMRIDQRNDGASLTINNTEVFPVDRWKVSSTGSNKVTAQRNAGNITPPAGFKNYIGVTCIATHSLSSSDNYSIYQWIEGYNINDLSFGTVDAAAITLSFWVYTNVTGVYSVRLVGANYSSSGYQSYVSTFTVTQSNTWQKITINVPACQAGQWEPTTGLGLAVQITLAAGSGNPNTTSTANTWLSGNWQQHTSQTVNIASTVGNIFYLTGVQLEKGSAATPFEYRHYGQELALCQRYLISYKSSIANGPYYRYCYGECVSSINFNGQVQLPVTMRITPSVTTTGTATNYAVWSRATSTPLSAVPTIGGDGTSNQTVVVNISVASGLTQGSAGSLMSNNNQTSYLLFSAEL